MGYIFETEIESILHSIRARTIGEAESITLGELLTASIHPGIKAYFRAEVHKLLQKEREKEERSKKFPYALPEVMRLQEQMDLLLQYHYEFDQKDFDALLDEAVHFQFNYLCRPQFTLMNFLFENRRRAPVADIERKLDYCVEYGYYREIIRRYITDNGLAKIAYEEFETLLEKIDREIIRQHTSWELARMLKSLFAFIDAGLPDAHKKQGEPTLPVNAAVVFFEDKKQNDIQERLERERDANSLSEITVQELADIIERVRTGNDEARAVAQERPVRKPTRLKRKPVVEAPPELPPSLPKEPLQFPVSDPSDLFQPTARQESLPAVQKAQAGALDESSDEGTVGLPEEGIHAYFSRAEQKHFVKKLFHKDEVSFREALDTLNIISTWDEASQYLDQLFIVTGADPFSEEAIEFTDKIYAWFHPGEQKTA
ncbi:MAG TPA: hypothetical protein VII11_07940 [Bacteroidota bacterium]